MNTNKHTHTHAHNHTSTQVYAYTRVLTQTTSHIHPNKRVLIHTNTHTNTQNSHDIRQVQMKVSSFLWGIQCNSLTKISTECMSFKLAIFLHPVIICRHVFSGNCIINFF